MESIQTRILEIEQLLEIETKNARDSRASERQQDVRADSFDEASLNSIANDRQVIIAHLRAEHLKLCKLREMKPKNAFEVKHPEGDVCTYVINGHNSKPEEGLMAVSWGGAFAKSLLKAYGEGKNYFVVAPPSGVPKGNEKVYEIIKKLF